MRNHSGKRSADALRLLHLPGEIPADALTFLWFTDTIYT